MPDDLEAPTTTSPDLSVFDNFESNVQSYARSFPVIFDRAQDATIWDQQGKQYLDFLAGAGSLNYGHNNAVLRRALIDYIEGGGITHSLDLHTAAKERFLEVLNMTVLAPRGMNHVVMFTGPTGTNAVEAAFKLARNITGRHNIISFTNGFHGVSIGAMAATGNSHHRDAAGIPLAGATPMPYDGYLGDGVDTTEYIDKILSDTSSGVDHPAAAIVETIQGEGGLNIATFEWLRNLERICRKHDMLLIIDDIQAGCGRTGSFFSFDGAGISPDVVTLSKSLSGYGLPFAITLIKPEYDNWKPGQHNGTFRGNNHAFVTATAALDHYWSDGRFGEEIRRKADLVIERLASIVDRFPDVVRAKGRVMMQGLEFKSGDIAARVGRRAFDIGLIMETSGSEGQVLKCLAPLTITERELTRGLDIIERATRDVLNHRGKKSDLAAA